MSMRPNLKRPLILLDRDGTLIREMEYLSDPGKIIHLLPGVDRRVEDSLKRAGLHVVVVSNQAGVGRGLHDTWLR